METDFLSLKELFFLAISDYIYGGGAFINCQHLLEMKPENPQFEEISNRKDA